MVAGVAMAASVLGRGLIESHLPDTAWRLPVASIGYCLGFVIVVLGRLQLFTESTLSAVIPVAASPTLRNVGRLARLWGLVLAANLVGTLFIAYLATEGWVGTEASTKAMLDTSRSLLALSGWDAVRAAVPAGFLMAGIAWSLPGARRQEFFVLVFCTYFISLGEFAHVVAGAVEAWMLWLAGEASLSWALGASSRRRSSATSWADRCCSRCWPMRRCTKKCEAGCGTAKLRLAVRILRCPCGEIGRRIRLKIERRKACWFESGQGHHEIFALLERPVGSRDAVAAQGTVVVPVRPATIGTDRQATRSHGAWSFAHSGGMYVWPGMATPSRAGRSLRPSATMGSTMRGAG